jgi:hypothetical protein
MNMKWGKPLNQRKLTGGPQNVIYRVAQRSGKI